MKSYWSQLEQDLGRPVANLSFTAMQNYLRSAQRRGVSMMHTARPFAFYRKVFYGNQSRGTVLNALQDKRIADVGCGYTPYASDSMFRACHDAGIEFYGIDPLIGTDIRFSLRDRALVRATGGRAQFNRNAPGLEKALSTTAQDLPFEDASVDEILCSFLLFVWIEDEETLAEILGEFLRVLRPGGSIKLYPLHEWRAMHFQSAELRQLLENVTVSQTFIHGRGDWRVMPSLLTELRKN